MDRQRLPGWDDRRLHRQRLSCGLDFFASGAADFAASEIPYGVQIGSNSNPPPSRGYAYIPDAAGGLAFMYNLSVNGQRVTNLRLSGAVIAGIFTNQITVWNDPRIAADNPGLTLPATSITPVVRSDSDGTTFELTQWMSATEGCRCSPRRSTRTRATRCT